MKVRDIRLFILALLAAAAAGSLRAADFPNETLRYAVTYKWGVIQKDAGSATLTLRNNGDRYDITLTGRTLDWADKYYTVRDTLRSTILRQGMKPLGYTRIAHEGGRFSRDDLSYSYHGNVVMATARRQRERDGKTTVSEKTHSASGLTFDMLSVFYFLRTIDFEALASGKPMKVSMFSGSKVETLTVRYVKRQTISLRDKSRREAYVIRFNFTGEGGRRTSDDIEAWISTDSRHIPLLLVGNLAIGKIKCYLLSGA